MFSPIPPRTARRAGSITAKLLTAVLPLAAAACQSSPIGHSGFLSSYEGLADRTAGIDGPQSIRDDVLSDEISIVYILPSVLDLEEESGIALEDLTRVRNEVDRQICYEVSERFDLAPEPVAGVGLIRSVITRVEPTSRVGSAVSAVAGFFIPVPVVQFRVPSATGGLAVEAELMTSDGQQAAAIIWSRSVEVVSRTDPSLSPVGDALQLAEPLGDAVGDAFASDARKVRSIPEPDPCARFGPRRDVQRFIGSRLVGAATGLYVPSVAGSGRPVKGDEQSPR